MQEKKRGGGRSRWLLPAALVLAGAAWFENFTLSTSTVTAVCAALPEAFSGLRIVQISDLHGVCTEPALHQALDAQKLPDCSACPRTAVSLLRLVFLRVCACRVSHLSIRSAVKIPCDQIVKTRCRHYGNDACPDVKSYAFFLEITHHSTGRVESVSAAARKQHAVYFLTCL